MLNSYRSVARRGAAENDALVNPSTDAHPCPVELILARYEGRGRLLDLVQNHVNGCEAFLVYRTTVCDS